MNIYKSIKKRKSKIFNNSTIFLRKRSYQKLLKNMRFLTKQKHRNQNDRIEKSNFPDNNLYSQILCTQLTQFWNMNIYFKIIFLIQRKLFYPFLNDTWHTAEQFNFFCCHNTIWFQRILKKRYDKCILFAFLNWIFVI